MPVELSPRRAGLRKRNAELPPLAITSWNLNKGDFASRMSAAPPADVYVFQEVAGVGQSIVTSPDYTSEVIDWAGSYGVVATVIRHKEGKIEPLSLVGVHTHKSHGYVAGLNKMVAEFGAEAARRSVWIGDFNSNKIWDHERKLNHSHLVSQFAELGLKSAYHSVSGEDFGSETTATFYLYRHLTRPFHIDYAFTDLPVAAVSVGSPSVYISLSDHMPLSLTLAV